MALTLYTTVSGTTTQLNDGAPFRLESAEGLSGADVVRYEQHGPFQSGATDLGYRLNAGIVTLNILFYATTAPLLDTYRAALMAAFKPLDSTSIFLSAQRDDGEIRTLTCFTVGNIDIALVPENYPGHLHRATVNLRAARPLWNANAVTIGSVNFSGLTSWWLAGGAINVNNVRTNAGYDYPAQSNVNPFAGTITGDWSVAVVTSKGTPDATQRYAWQDGTGGSASFGGIISGTSSIFTIDDGGNPHAWPGTTGYNYHVVESRSGVQTWLYWTGTALGTAYTEATDVSLRGGSNFSWRSSRLGGNTWTPELRKAVILGTVTIAQLTALVPYMLNTVPGTVTVVNDGDVNAYPIMTIRGPMADPVIVNTTTSSTVNLTGVTIGSADIMTIDLRDGNKQIYSAAGSSLLGSVTTFPISLASFYLAPHPIATGGTNTFVLTPGSAGSASSFSVQITNQYLSF